MKTPINTGFAQSNVDFNNFKGVNLDLSDYPGQGLNWNPITKKLDVTGATSSPLVTVNVQDSPYNAVGNGVADDTVAIQTAINDCFNMGGGTVFFPRGTYLCNGNFDATTNSVLRLPIQNYDVSQTVGIELLGETFIGWVGGPNDNDKVTAITTTKSPSGTFPALFAANAYSSDPSVTEFNNIMLRMKNLWFSSGALSGLRLDRCGFVILDNLVVFGPFGVPPPAGNVGLWMPKTDNFAVSYANNVNVLGCDTAMKVGEHFRSPNFLIAYSNTGIEFEFANESSYAFGQFIHCIHNISFTGEHSVDIFADIEYANPVAPDGALTTTADIYDPNNWGGGFFRYNIIKADVGIVEDDAQVTGGNKITLMNLHKGKITMGPTASISGKGTIPAGGTTGQSLKKLSNTDYDVGWG